MQANQLLLVNPLYTLTEELLSLTSPLDSSANLYADDKTRKSKYVHFKFNANVTYRWNFFQDLTGDLGYDFNHLLDGKHCLITGQQSHYPWLTRPKENVYFK